MIFKLRLSDIKNVAPIRNPTDPQKYIDDVLAASDGPAENDVVTISIEKYNDIRKKYASENKTSLMDQAKAAIHGAASIIKTGILGVDVASEELQKERLAICKQCPECTLRNGEPWTCGVLLQQTKNSCGCILKSKSKDVSQKCPQNKW